MDFNEDCPIEKFLHATWDLTVCVMYMICMTYILPKWQKTKTLSLLYPLCSHFFICGVYKYPESEGKAVYSCISIVNFEFRSTTYVVREDHNSRRLVPTVLLISILVPEKRSHKFLSNNNELSQEERDS